MSRSFKSSILVTYARRYPARRFCDLQHEDSARHLSNSPQDRKDMITLATTTMILLQTSLDSGKPCLTHLPQDVIRT